ncbi:MAG: L-rhamnose mutarotase [Saprospiraceae bacterium]|nr:L-rhamnose mutarotase [Saprospiraceae bacterium]
MKYCLALDLKNEPALIRSYRKFHEKVWPDVLRSLTDVGIQQMEIYSVENRLFMMIETTRDFSFEHKANSDAENPIVQEWESLMDQFQEKLQNTPDGVKWRLMEKVFDLADQVGT